MRARVGYTRRDGTRKSEAIRTTKSYRYYCPQCPIYTCITVVLRPWSKCLNRQQYINFNEAIHGFIDNTTAVKLRTNNDRRSGRTTGKTVEKPVTRGNRENQTEKTTVLVAEKGRYRRFESRPGHPFIWRRNCNPVFCEHI